MRRTIAEQECIKHLLDKVASAFRGEKSSYAHLRWSELEEIRLIFIELVKELSNSAKYHVVTIEIMSGYRKNFDKKYRRKSWPQDVMLNTMCMYVSDKEHDWEEYFKLYRASQPTHFVKDELRIRLRKAYKADEFQKIRVVADSYNSIGSLHMGDYYHQLSYVKHEEIEKRESLAHSEQNIKKEDKRQKKTQVLHQVETGYISERTLKGNLRTVVQGNPGVGKSTYSRWLCYKWLSSGSYEDSIPIYLPLRYVKDEEVKINMILSYIKKKYLKDTTIKEEDLRKFWIEYPKEFLLVFDGYDELDSSNKHRLYKDYSEIGSNEVVPFVLLSRPYGLQGLLFQQDTIIQIDGFNESSVHNYITNIVTAANKSHKSSSDLLSIIRENTILKESSYTPLLLSYIVLIYLNDEDYNHTALKNIQSAFELQEVVYQWLIDYSLRRSVSMKKSPQLEKEAMKFAYDMQVNKEITYDSRVKGDSARNIANYLADLGLGYLTENKKIGDYWKFVFRSLSFQEFLSARYLLDRITVHAILYLTKDIYFSNVVKLVIGGLSSNDRKNNQRLDTLFRNIEQKSDLTHKLMTYNYIDLLGETTSSYLAGRVNEEIIEQFLSSYEGSYFNDFWRLNFKKALRNLYIKLPLYHQNTLKNNVIKRTKELYSIDYTKREGVALMYLLLDIVDATDIEDYPDFIQEILKIINKMFDDVNAVIEGQLEEEDNDEYEESEMEEGGGDEYEEDDDIFEMQDEESEIINSLFLLLTCLIETKPERLERHREEIFNLVKKCPQDLRVDIEILFVKVLTKEEVISYFDDAVKQVRMLPSFDSGHLNASEILENIDNELEEDDDELSKNSKDNLQKLLDLAAAIFRMGAKNAYQSQQIHLAVNLVIDKFLHPNILRYVGFEADYICNLIVSGLTNFSDKDSIAMVGKVGWKLERNGLEEFNNNKIFMGYIEEHLDSHLPSLDKDSLPYITYLLANTINGRYNFFSYRTKIWKILENWVIKNQVFFQKNNYQEVMQDDRKRGEPIKNIIGVPYFAYDRKFFIDNLLNLIENRPNSYLKEYVLPYLFEHDFPLYQPRYWEYLESTSSYEDLPESLMDILISEGVYWYSSNLHPLVKILSIASRNEDTLKNNNFPLLKVVSNTLILLLKSISITQKDIEKNIIEVSKKILHKEEIKEVYTSLDYFAYLGAKDIMGYIILFYFTREDEDRANFDYNTYKEIAPAEYQDFISLIVNLFSDNYDGIKKETFLFLEQVLPEQCIADIRDYLQYHEVVYFNFNKSELDKRLRASN